MKKRVLALMMVAAIGCGVTIGCGSNKTENGTATENSSDVENENTETNSDADLTDDDNLTGAYQLEQGVGGLSAEDEQRIQQATGEMTGSNIEPLALVGSQIVSGTNYAYLCKMTPVTQNPTPHLSVVVVNENLEKAIQLMDIYDVDLNQVLSEERKDGELLEGGWECPSTSAAVTLPENVTTVFEKAKENYTGVTLEPYAYLGSQVVAGSNHLLLCKSETVTAEPVSAMTLVVVYEGVNGETEITGVYPLDLNQIIS